LHLESLHFEARTTNLIPIEVLPADHDAVFEYFLRVREGLLHFQRASQDVLADIILIGPFAQAVLVLGSNLDNDKVSSNLPSESRNFSHGDLTLPVLNYSEVFAVAVSQDLVILRHIVTSLGLESDLVLSHGQFAIARSSDRFLPRDLNIGVD
jgi:hypothetical protein